MRATSVQGISRHDAGYLFTLMLRRSLLAAARNIYDIQSQLDCAEMALSLGLEIEARLLFEIAFIAGGYDSAGLEMQEHLAQQTGLWSHAPTRAVEDPITNEIPMSPITRGATALRTLLKSSDAKLADQSEQISFMENSPRQSALTNKADWNRRVQLIHDMHLSLRQPLNAVSFTAIIAAVVENVFVDGEPGIDEHIDAPLDQLVFLIAGTVMRTFCRNRYNLVASPLGSAALLHQAAGLERHALGPYFQNVGNLVRGARDVIGLTLNSLNCRLSDPDAQRAIALLSIGLTRDQRADLIDLLADEGSLAAIHALCKPYRQVGCVPADRRILWKLRDAAIDLDDPILGASIQARLCQLAPFAQHEWLIFGDILVAAKNLATARDVYAKARELDALPDGLGKRIAEALDGSGDPIHVPHGYGSTPWRRTLRRSNMQKLIAETGASGRQDAIPY